MLEFGSKHLKSTHVPTLILYKCIYSMQFTFHACQRSFMSIFDAYADLPYKHIDGQEGHGLAVRT